MSRNSYILLSDYAKSENLSIDEARELLNREENKQFFKIANGREMVSLEIRKAPARIEIKEDKEISTEEAEKSKVIPVKQIGETEHEIEQLRKEIEELREQIKSKDKQIAEYAFRFAELAQQAQIIAGQAQALQAQEKKILDEPAHQKKNLFTRLFKR